MAIGFPMRELSGGYTIAFLGGLCNRIMKHNEKLCIQFGFLGETGTQPRKDSGSTIFFVSFLVQA